EFRVLLLEPGAGQDAIHTRLITVDLSMNVQYEALSYAWGNTKSLDSISCNGRLTGVASNLYSALSHLRHPTKLRVIWVDVLCIDQTDEDERAQQVRLMRDIYSKAKRVLVWVGEETPDVEKAFSILLQSAPVAERYSIEFIDWNAVIQLLDWSWFTRVWVLQEVAHASKVTLI
ncbi:HET-domain-containing protein, partial [Cadophora sp. DSE1049]